MRQAESVGGVRLLGRDHATPWPLVGRRGTREHDGDDEAVAIHDGRPHVEIEAAVGFVPGLDERGLERVEAGDPTQAQVERGTADTVIAAGRQRSEEHTSELQSRLHLVCRLLLEKKKPATNIIAVRPPYHGIPTLSHTQSLLITVVPPPVLTSLLTSSDLYTVCSSGLPG